MDYNKKISVLLSKIDGLVRQLSLLSEPVDMRLASTFLKKIEKTKNQIQKMKIRREFGKHIS